MFLLQRRHRAASNSLFKAMNTLASTNARPLPAADAGESATTWQMKRRCALSPGQLLLSYGALVVLSVSIALFFILNGVWMILLWCLLEIAIAGAMYFYYMMHAADGERVSFSPDGTLAIEVVRGLNTRHYQMNPAWARLERTGAHRQRLWLCCSPLRIEVATQLRLAESRRIERELKRALATSRSQGMQT